MQEYAGSSDVVNAILVPARYILELVIYHVTLGSVLAK